MAYWSGVRSGWNTEGGSPSFLLREQIDSVAFQNRHQRELVDPNSSWWQAMADVTHLRLEELLGSDYELWAEITWPNDTIEQFTHKEIYERMYFAFKNPKITLDELECTCNGVTNLCKVCQAHERVRARHEMIAEVEA